VTTQLTQFSQPKPARLIHHVSWEQLDEIDYSLENISGLKLAYLDGVLEIMPISDEHEGLKSTIALLLEADFRTKGIRFYKRGGPTLGSRDISARNEPDESYNIGTRKPYPDLVIEIVKTSGGINKVEGCRRLRVTEVWIWEDGVLTIHQLQDNAYQAEQTSALLPELPVGLLLRYVSYYDQFDAISEFTSAL
jgi:Uma2 family endonuclease